ncbi:hypothetical protein [Gramella sp. AN32]|uniref:PRC-barrel domain-containing protein n=1 Tax=Christiangramia antarctica TaxID=2058158 RepID=A0ABW5X9Y8_9FLAO|nr:hypothetical protein [Gramella sp. AN32]MCM4156551.1 hypothetical protein [Gramella sp. AN32]
MSTKNEKHLYYFNELSGYKISSGDHDIRGWAVKDLENRIIGKVDNLLVNKDLGKVVYIDVEVDKTIIDANHDPYSEPANPNVREFINKEGENHLIIPIGLVSLNPESKYVYTETIDYQTFAGTKRYRAGNTIDRDYERAVLTSYNRKNRKSNIDNDRYEVERDSKSDITRRNDELTQEEIAQERLRLEREKLELDRLAEQRRNQDHERTHDENLRNESTEERIQREKANMKYKSDNLDNTRLDEPVVDRDHKDYDDTWKKNTGSTTEDFKNYKRENTDTSWKEEGVERPIRTHDEDKNWSREETNLDRDEANRKRNRTETERDDDFYDRNEFRNRNY